MDNSFEPQVRIVDRNGVPKIEYLPPAFKTAEGVPSPYAHLLAGLGTCTTLTLRMYADRQSLPVEQIVVELRHRKVPVADSNEKTDEFQRMIKLSGTLSHEQRQRLLDIAAKCPVSRTLSRTSPVVLPLRGAD